MVSPCFPYVERKWQHSYHLPTVASSPNRPSAAVMIFPLPLQLLSDPYMKSGFSKVRSHLSSSSPSTTTNLFYQAFCSQETLTAAMDGPPGLSRVPQDHSSWGAAERKEKQEPEVDLKSRGLCLVPVACTPQMYRENNGPDYWTPTYRGCLYR